ncbi:Putative Trp repressor protein [Elusimicrobium minutum Pei191]|uniref:Putative Trp repressor protein n=1 Tax=Elusimicrobium minutum (strain Pei191) TaxID=445932 RepID=B2KCI4_ELUMP|nr:Trp family transcriptional regulator [Elusimicrobium minutum]ACC98105.1 Putative Trp repressor protein [Elusimicrobium minutum Pei191]
MSKFTSKMQRQSVKSFANSVLTIKDGERARLFLEEIFTPAEIKKISLRWRLVEMLSAGHSQRSIANHLGISLCKITRGAKILNKKNSITKQLLEERGFYDNVKPKKTDIKTQHINS